MSDFVAIPEAGVGAVILTNAGNGQLLLRPFMRRLLEVLYDGRPEAAGRCGGRRLRGSKERLLRNASAWMSLRK